MKSLSFRALSRRFGANIAKVITIQNSGEQFIQLMSGKIVDAQGYDRTDAACHFEPNAKIISLAEARLVLIKRGINRHKIAATFARLSEVES
jgi:hypothetical protein